MDILQCLTTRSHSERVRATLEEKKSPDLINAVNEVTRERTQSFLIDDHLTRIVKAYQAFKDEPGFTRVATARRYPCLGRQPEHPVLCRTAGDGAR